MNNLEKEEAAARGALERLRLLYTPDGEPLARAGEQQAMEPSMVDILEDGTTMQDLCEVVRRGQEEEHNHPVDLFLSLEEGDEDEVDEEEDDILDDTEEFSVE